MNYAALKETDIADGPGVRVALYVSGCQLALDGHPCPGCHNFEAWDKNYGQPFTEETENRIIHLLKPSYIEGFSLLGGEPLSDFNIPREIQLLKHIKEEYPQKSVWLWTGYDLDEWKAAHSTGNPALDAGASAPDEAPQPQNLLQILDYVDTVVDGPFIQDLFDPTLKFRGSSNQRIINLKDSQ